MSYNFKVSAMIAAAAAALLSLAAMSRDAPGAVASHPAADLIIRNTKIWTVNPAQPQAEAVAILGDRIAAVGADGDVMQWRGSGTRIVDAHGSRLLPGFNDAHVHFSDGGASMSAVQLNDAASLKEFTARISAYAAHTPKGEWLRGGNFDETKWTPARLPTRQDIDALTPNNPVALDRYDGHMLLVNSKVLALAGITAKTLDPPGGVIVRDEKGQPTGALKDAATELVEKVAPARNFAQRRRDIETALREAAKRGVTSVQDMSLDYGDLAVYSKLLSEGKLTVRVYGAPLIATVEDQAKLGLGRAFGGPSLRIGALKMFADGSLGSRTAYFLQPYADENSNYGLLYSDMIPLPKASQWLMRADATNLQVCTHAIGDAAITTVLDLYQAVEKAEGPKDRRWRIEHSQHLAPKDFDRYAQLHVIASVQPYQAVQDGSWAEARIGHERAARMHAYRTFLNHGVRLAFGTDWPVAPLDPLLTLYAAVTRATLDGKNPQGWFPEQKLTVQEAIATYTMGSAYAEFQEQQKGSIEPGKLADLVLLSRDVLAISPAEIRDTRVLKTWVGGVQIYDSAPLLRRGN